jgi:hypothetical protein
MKLATLVLCTSAAFGQLPPKQDATIALAYTPTPQSVKQMTTIVKTLAHIQDVSFDETHSSFTLRGPANLLGLSEWLLHAMDKPVGWQPTLQESDNPSSREYHQKTGGYSIDDKTPVTRVYYLKNTTTPLGVQEILTTLRVVGNIPEVFACDGPGMMAFRGTATGVDLEEWMIRKLDVPAGGRENSADNVFKLSSEDIVRVFYLDPATSPKGISDLARNIRETTKTRNIFWKTSPPTITVRGNSALLAQAQQIIETGPNR